MSSGMMGSFFKKPWNEASGTRTSAALRMPSEDMMGNERLVAQVKKLPSKELETIGDGVEE